MKLILSVICLVFWQIGFCQSEVEFKVAASKSITIYPLVDTLLSNHEYHFTISGISMRKIVNATFTEGIAAVTDSGILITTGKYARPGRKYALQIFALRGSKLSEIGRKSYTLIALKDLPKFDPNALLPKRVWGGWTRRPLNLNDTIAFRSFDGMPKQISIWLQPVRVKIISFEITFLCAGKSETLTTTGEMLSDEMLKRFSLLKPGCTITLDKVKYFTTNGLTDQSLLGPFHCYIKK